MTDRYTGTSEAALRALGAHAVPVEGGFSGETFLVGDEGEQAVLRLYVSRPDRAAVDAALLDLVRGLLPVPQVLDLRTTQMTDGQAPAYLLTEVLPGSPLDTVLPDADDGVRRRAATGVADVLARLGGIPFRRPGELVGPDLAVQPWPPFAAGLLAWVDQHLLEGALATWGEAERRSLRELARHADGLFAQNDRWCLAHSDFNAKNLLVDPATGDVTGLVDWEFAHAGTPYTDLGNLLRLERDPGFVQPLLERYVDRAPSTPDDLLDRARAADLWALVELASRAGQHAPADRAHDLLRAIAANRDLHACPAERV